MTIVFHKDNFGSFGENLPADINGYVSTADTDPWDLVYDHGTEKTHATDGTLTEYGEWWESEGFPELQEEAIQATQDAEASIAESR